MGRLIRKGNRKRRAKGVQGPAYQPDQEILDAKGDPSVTRLRRGLERGRRARDARAFEKRGRALTEEERRISWLKARHGNYKLRKQFPEVRDVAAHLYQQRKAHRDRISGRVEGDLLP